MKKSLLLLMSFSALLLCQCSSPVAQGTGAAATMKRPAATVKQSTRYQLTLVEFDGPMQGKVVSGSITTNAPLGQASSGSYQLQTHEAGIMAHSGQVVCNLLNASPSGRVAISRNGSQLTLALMGNGGTIATIKGTVTGNSLSGRWYYEGHNSGTASLR